MKMKPLGYWSEVMKESVALISAQKANKDTAFKMAQNIVDTKINNGEIFTKQIGIEFVCINEKQIPERIK